MQALASTHTILQPYYRMTPVRGSRVVSYRENAVREDYRDTSQLGPYNTHSLETSLKTEDYIDTVRIRGTPPGTKQYTHTALKLPSKRHTQQHAGTRVHTHYITGLL